MPSPREQPVESVHDDAVEDAALAKRVVAGDAAAEAQLCRRVLPRARAWGLKHLRDEATALDLAQHASMTLIEALRAGRVQQLDRVGAFLIGVCQRTLSSWHAGERRRSDLLERYGPALEGVAQINDGALDARRLAGCFERLAPRAQSVVALTFFAERSSDEIAGELGTSPGNVRVLRHRALEQLQQCMEGK